MDSEGWGIRDEGFLRRARDSARFSASRRRQRPEARSQAKPRCERWLSGQSPVANGDTGIQFCFSLKKRKKS